MLLLHIYSYQATEDDFVDYLRFSDDIESIFTTKNLEKAPLLAVSQFRPPEEWELNKLDDEMESLLMNSIGRLAEQVINIIY